MDDYRKFKLGVGAIAWTNPGIPQFEDTYTSEQIIADMSKIGYEGTEMNRKFPSEPKELHALLGHYQMRISSQYKAVVFSDPSYTELELNSFKKHADFLHMMGCQHAIVCEMGGSAHWDPRHENAGRITPLTEEEWSVLISNLHQAGEYCRQLGMKLLYHYHAGTVIEQRNDIDLLMERTNPELVSLLFDTGHAYFGNYEPIELLQAHITRIDYIHLKDVRKHVLAEVKNQGWDFKQGVVQGMFTVPGDGDIDFIPIFTMLLESAFQSWIIVEAEQNPTAANPYEYGKKAKLYIDRVVSDLV